MPENSRAIPVVYFPSIVGRVPTSSPGPWISIRPVHRWTPIPRLSVHSKASGAPRPYYSMGHVVTRVPNNQELVLRKAPIHSALSSPAAYCSHTPYLALPLSPNASGLGSTIVVALVLARLIALFSIIQVHPGRGFFDSSRSPNYIKKGIPFIVADPIV